MNYKMFFTLLKEFCQDCKVLEPENVVIKEYSGSILTFVWYDEDGKEFKRVYDYLNNARITITSEELNLPF